MFVIEHNNNTKGLTLSLTPQDISLIGELESKGLNIIDNLDLLLPEDIDLSYLAGLCGKGRDTIRKYLITNFIDGEDYFQKVEGGKIYVARAAALDIRRHYVK